MNASGHDFAASQQLSCRRLGTQLAARALLARRILARNLLRTPSFRLALGTQLAARARPRPRFPPAPALTWYVSCFLRLTYVVVTSYTTPVKTLKFVLMAALMALIAVSAHADASNVVSSVVNTLGAANVVSTPFNPFAPLIAQLLSMVGPLAMFLCGVFSHKSGVATGQGGVK